METNWYPHLPNTLLDVPNPSIMLNYSMLGLGVYHQSLIGGFEYDESLLLGDEVTLPYSDSESD